MTPSDRLKIAGVAAELLEQMGFVSVARLADGVVTLECWDRAVASGRLVQHIVDGDAITDRLLADTCASLMRGGASRGAS